MERFILDDAAVLDPPLDIPGFELPSVITGEEKEHWRYKKTLHHRTQGWF